MNSKVRLKMLVHHPDSDIVRECFKDYLGASRPFRLGKILNSGKTAKINYMIDTNPFSDDWWQYGFRFFSIIDYRLYEKKY